eukprot:scaffold349155_cov23-Prasinocladus_malaysianus.AAC.1
MNSAFHFKTHDIPKTVPSEVSASRTLVGLHDLSSVFHWFTVVLFTTRIIAMQGLFLCLGNMQLVPLRLFSKKYQRFAQCGKLLIILLESLRGTRHIGTSKTMISEEENGTTETSPPLNALWGQGPAVYYGLQISRRQRLPEAAVYSGDALFATT